MNQIQSKSFLPSSLVILGFSVIIGFFLCSGKELTALIAGFLLFTVNFWFIIRIYSAIVAAQMTSEGSSMPGSRASVLGVLKLCFLALAIYVALVPLQLPSAYFVGGSLISIVAITRHYLADYLGKAS